MTQTFMINIMSGKLSDRMKEIYLIL